MADKTIDVDIYSRYWHNDVRWIPSPVSRESPQMKYSISLTNILELLQHSEVWIYDSDTKLIINLTNLNSYFPEYVPPWERGGGGQGTKYVMSGMTDDWNAQPSLIGEKDVIYVYLDYMIDDLGDPIPGMKVGDGSTLLSQLPFTASSEGGGGGGEKEILSNTTAAWSAKSTLVSKKDTLYIYTDHRTVDGVSIPGMKFGDGVSLLKDLPFMDESETVSQEEKDRWNSNVSVKTSSKPGEENLIFY